MYDRKWSRETVLNYYKLRTRAQQINMCIQQIYEETTGRKCLVADITAVLTSSVQGKEPARIWRAYKRLVKVTPLDYDLLKSVTNIIISKVDVEKLQRQFEFT